MAPQSLSTLNNFKTVMFFFFHFYLFRSLGLISKSKWKMRELHVFVLYYSYFTFRPFIEELPYNSKQLFRALKYLLRGVHFVKGFSMKVIKNLIRYVYVIGNVSFKNVYVFIQENGVIIKIILLLLFYYIYYVLMLLYYS